jgi:hypothetical protein
MSDDETTSDTLGVDAADDGGIDRRSLLKKVGIAGAAAWVAPVVIDSMISPASALSIPPGTYRLRLSSEKCNPTPVLDPDAVPPPANCTELAGNYPTTTFTITSQAQLDALDIVVSNCNRRYDIQVSTTNPKVTFTDAGSGNGNARLRGQCLLPSTPGAPGPFSVQSVQWANQPSDRNGYFIVINVSA